LMIKAKASREGLRKISTDDRTDHQFGEIFGYWITNKKNRNTKAKLREKRTENGGIAVRFD